MCTLPTISLRLAKRRSGMLVTVAARFVAAASIVGTGGRVMTGTTVVVRAAVGEGVSVGPDGVSVCEAGDWGGRDEEEGGEPDDEDDPHCGGRDPEQQAWVEPIEEARRLLERNSLKWIFVAVGHSPGPVWFGAYCIRF